MASGLLTVIEITDTHLKVLQARRGAAAPFFFKAQKIEDPSEEGIRTLLASMIEPKMRKSHVIACLPRREVMSRSMSLPTQSDQELKKMIALQVPQGVPYSKDDIVFDHLVLSKNATGYSEVLAIVVHRELVERYFHLLAKAGLTVQGLSLSSVNIVNWLFLHAQGRPYPLGDFLGILHVDTATSEIVFCERERCIFSRFIQFGACDFQADNERVFFREIALTFETFAREREKPSPEKLVIISSRINGDFIEGLQNELNLNVVHIDPYEGLKETKALRIPRVAQGDYYSPVVCWGATAKGPQRQFNFLPKAIAQERHVKEKNIQFVSFFALAALCAALVGAVFFYQHERVGRYLKDVTEKAAALKPRLDAMEAKNERIRVIENYLTAAPLAVDIIDEIYRLTPADMSFRLITFDADNRLTLQGMSEERSSVNDFQAKLVNSAMFSEVNLQYATQRRVFEGEITDFKINARLQRLKR